jgi:multiple antibiotic resistance protein
MVTYLLLCFGSLFPIVDPFALVPIFLALVGEEPRQAQARTALRATFTCAIVLSLFAAGGTFIFRFFSITVPAFKIAGGVLLFGIGLEMMRAKISPTRGTEEEETEAEKKDDVGLIPLGIPLLAGPGSIATVMVLVGKAKGMTERASVFIAILAVSVITFLVLRSAAFVSRVLGKTGINVIGRVMGLLLAAVAMQFVIDGLYEAFPNVLGPRIG